MKVIAIDNKTEARIEFDIFTKDLPILLGCKNFTNPLNNGKSYMIISSNMVFDKIVNEYSVELFVKENSLLELNVELA